MMFRLMDIAVILVEVFIFMTLCDGFLTAKNGKYRLISALSFLAVQLISLAIDSSNMFVVMIICLCACGISTLFWGGTKRSKLFVAVGYFIISTTSEFLLGGILLLINDISSLSLLEPNIYRVVGMVGSKMVQLIITKAVCVLFGKKQAVLYRKYWCALLPVPVLCTALILMMARYYSSMTENAYAPFLMASIIILATSILVFYLFSSLIKSMEYKYGYDVLEKQIENQRFEAKADYFENQKFREVKHDFKNHLLVINSYLENGDLKSASEHLNELDIIDKHRVRISRTHNLPLDSIINSKLAAAESRGIKVITEITKIPLDINLSGVEAAMLLGNLFDNAIENYGQVEDSEYGIKFVMGYKHERLAIVISNTTDKTVMFDENGMPITDKSDNVNHGIGMKSISKVVTAHNGMIDLSQEGNIFTVKVVLNNI